MAEVTYGNCDRCNTVNDVYAVYQYMKVGILTNKGKKFVCICYSCSDILIQEHNIKAYEEPAVYIPIPFTQGDSRKNAKIVLSNSSYENNIYELASDDGSEEVEDVSDEFTETQPVNDQERVEVKPDLKLIKGGMEKVKKSIHGLLPKYSAQEIFDKLTLQIIGQDKAMRELSIAAERYLESMKDTNVKKLNVLITGKTAVGKTDSVNALQEILGIPVLSYNMKNFTASGYVGKDVSEIINQACEITANGERPRAIILLDEIDKLGTNGSSESFLTTDVYYELLTMMEGRRSVVSGKKNSGESSRNVDTSELFFIMAGSFHKVMDRKAAKMNYKPVGLDKKESNLLRMRLDLLDVEITNEDLNSIGMPDEFIGRIQKRISYRTLSENDYIKIITTSTTSALKSYQEYFKKRNIDLGFDHSYLVELANIALSSGLGVRGVTCKLEEDLSDVMFDHTRYLGGSVVIKKDKELEFNKERSISV